MQFHAPWLRGMPVWAKPGALAMIVAALVILGAPSADRSTIAAADRSSNPIISAEIAVGSFALLVRVTAR